MIEEESFTKVENVHDNCVRFHESMERRRRRIHGFGVAQEDFDEEDAAAECFGERIMFI